MFEISWTELLVVAVLCVVLFKPKDLPDAMRALGRGAAWIKRTVLDMQEQFRDAMRDAELDDVHKAIEDVRDLRSLSPLNQVKNAIGKIGNDEAVDLLPPAAKKHE